MFDPFCIMFHHAAYFFSNFQPQAWHGGGFARAAHWIRRPRVAGGRACVNRVTKSIKSFLSNPSRKGSRGSAARAQMAAPARIPTGGPSIFRLQLAMLTHFWSSLSSSFCHHSSNMFLNRFSVHFGSQNASKILFQIHSKSIQKLDRKTLYFWDQFSEIFSRFCTQLD